MDVASSRVYQKPREASLLWVELVMNVEEAFWEMLDGMELQ